MRGFDFGSWEGVLTAVAGIALISLIGVGLRLLVMLTIQQRQQTANRQINERLRILIAAYKTLGGSFTGNLQVDPTHLRELRERAESSSMAAHAAAAFGSEGVIPASSVDPSRGERARRIRDAVEGALSDILLLGTEMQVRLAATAARALVEGQPIHTGELVVSLRSFIREVLGLEAVPGGVSIPAQGPARPSGSSKGGARDSGRDGSQGSGRDGSGGGGGAGGGAAGAGMGAGMGMTADSEGGER
jgi:hypothetical protein